MSVVEGFCPFSDSECTGIFASRIVSGCLSILGCSFMLFILFLTRKFRFFPQRIILNMTIAAFFSAISYLITPGGSSGHIVDGHYCNFQGWMVTYFEWALLLWVCMICINVLFTVVKHSNISKYELYITIFCWGFPFIPSIVPLITDHYEPAGFVCWIGDDHAVERYLLWYAPLFVLIFTMIGVYCFVAFVVHRRSKKFSGTYNPDYELEKDTLKKDVKPLAFYPLAYLILHIFALVNRIRNTTHPDDPIFALVLIHAIVAPLQGFVNAILFGVDKETLSQLNWDNIRLKFSPTRKEPLVQKYNIGGMSQEAGVANEGIDNEENVTEEHVYPEDEEINEQLKQVSL